MRADAMSWFIRAMGDDDDACDGVRCVNDAMGMRKDVK
jgi:hypothetical protein